MTSVEDDTELQLGLMTTHHNDDHDRYAHHTKRTTDTHGTYTHIPDTSSDDDKHTHKHKHAHKHTPHESHHHSRIANGEFDENPNQTAATQTNTHARKRYSHSRTRSVLREVCCCGRGCSYNDVRLSIWTTMSMKASQGKLSGVCCSYVTCVHVLYLCKRVSFKTMIVLIVYVVCSLCVCVCVRRSFQFKIRHSIMCNKCEPQQNYSKVLYYY